MSGQRVCPGDALLDGGSGQRFSVRFGDETVPAFVIRYRGQVHAFLNRCGHQPVELDWQEGEFFDASGLYLICATHGALYAPDSGKCLGGRCSGKGLVALEAREIDGWVVVDEKVGNGVGRQ